MASAKKTLNADGSDTAEAVQEHRNQVAAWLDLNVRNARRTILQERITLEEDIKLELQESLASVVNEILTADHDDGKEEERAKKHSHLIKAIEVNKRARKDLALLLTENETRSETAERAKEKQAHSELARIRKARRSA